MERANPAGRLHFLDGLRGLACLYVLLFHASHPNLPPGGALTPWAKLVTDCLSRGHWSVVFFIVLSGFSISLPIARSGGYELRGGFASFAYRRARRILPPYYAALLLSIALLVAYGFLSRRTGAPPVVDGALSTGSIVSHLLLVHNWFFDWAFRIDGPLWSVATEWQIYFIFALVLLPLWRRTGDIVTLVACWSLGLASFVLLPDGQNLSWACPWFLGSFAFGMWGASIGFSAPQDSWLRQKAPWGLMSWALFVVLVALVATGLADAWPTPFVDIIVSLFAFCLINTGVRHAATHAEGQSLLLRLLGSRALVGLGAFSYSLYLVQHPVLRLAEKVVAKVTTSWDANIVIHLLFAVPVTMAAGWLFAEFFERPFTSGGVVLPALRRRIGLLRDASATPEVARGRG